MASNPIHPGPSRRLLWLVALATWLGYAAFNVGELTPDPQTRYLVAESIVRDGDLAISPNGLTAAADDGTHYSVFFPGQTLLFLPVAGATEIARRVVGGSPATWTMAGDFIACVAVVPFFAALSVLGHIRLLGALAVGPRAAVASGVALAFATQHWVWGTAGSEEIELAAIAAWTFALGLESVRRVTAVGAGEDAVRRAARDLGVSGVLIALGLAHRGTFLPVAAGFVALTLVPILRSPAGRGAFGRLTLRLLPWFVTACVIVALVPLYNLVRFGDPADSGYGRFYGEMGGLWATPWLEGIGGHLISPGKSVFLYSPWLLLLLPATLHPATWRRLGPLGPAIAVAAIGHLLIYSRTTFWSGAFGFGVRFHVSMMSLLLVPIAVWLTSWRPRGGWRHGLAALAVVSVIAQGLGLALNTGYEFLADRSAYDPDEERIPRAAAWDPARSPFLIRAKAVARKVAGGDILPPGEPESKRIQAAWNVFPVRASIAFGGPPRDDAAGDAAEIDRMTGAARPPAGLGRTLVPILWGGWALLVALFGATMWLLVGSWRSLPPDADPAPPTTDAA